MIIESSNLIGKGVVVKFSNQKTHRGLLLLLLGGMGLAMPAWGTGGQKDHGAPATGIELWTRGPGLHADGAEVKKDQSRRLAIDSLKPRAMTVMDVQYGRKVHVKAVPLLDVVNHFHDMASDRVILHFANGMAVPLERKDLESGGPLHGKIFVANAYGETPKKWNSQFPPVGKKDDMKTDPRPIEFKDLKLVVTTPWYRQGRPTGKDLFSPWKHTDTPVGLEWVDGAAYDRQFHMKGGADVAAGQQVFMARCQYCHGVQKVGASLGWDFGGPIAIAEKRDPSSLLFHAKYKKVDALERGLLMPNQKDFSEKEAGQLWAWLKVVSTSKVGAYKP